MPLSLEGLVPDDDSVRLLSHELEELDYTLLYKAYSSKGRNPAIDPKTMFKILTYAYSQNIYSSRNIEKACLRDINFMWLLAGQKAPDHSTIARFGQVFFWRHVKISEAVMLLNHEYMQSFSVKIDSRIQDLQTITRYLENKCQQDGTVFVYGRGKRKSKNQKYFELF